MSLAQDDKEIPFLSSADTASFASKKVTTRSLIEMKKVGKKIACLTAYDALIARIVDEAGIDLILIGDSLGNVVQGHPTTIPVTLEDIIYHTRAITRGASRALVVSDMPFMTYQVTPQEAFRNAGRIMKEAGASAVKLEGGKRVLEAVSLMSESGIPVMGHLGLTPQSINKFGSYQARGVNQEEAKLILEDAILLEEAGAFAVVLEKIPAELSKKITASLKIPTIGIGAGPYCDGQILVYTDMLGLTDEFNPRFVRRYAHFHKEALEAVRNYTSDIKSNNFPSLDESY